MRARTTGVLMSGAVLAVFLLMSRSLNAQCPPGQVVIAEDKNYWYCDYPAPYEEGVKALGKARDGLLGDKWRFHKAMIEAATDLVKGGIKVKSGGKLRVTSDGWVDYECVAQQCKEIPQDTVDCSGASAYGELSACLVSETCKAAFALLKQGMDNSAAGQASYFYRYGAFIAKKGAPTPGDLIFFKGTSQDPAAAQKFMGITHVAIFIGTDSKGRFMILHASQINNRVLFQWISPSDFLGKKIAGYGDVSHLNYSLIGR